MTMKQLAAVLLLAACAVLAACGSGSGSNAGNVNGSWTASLSEANNQTYGSLGLSMVVNNDGTLTVSNLTITAPSPCFNSAGSTATGSFSLMGNFNGNVTGQFSMTVQSGSAGAGNTLALTGTANGNTISGTWKVTGDFGCTGNGTFTMTRAQ
jgi:hypothetical protein